MKFLELIQKNNPMWKVSENINKTSKFTGFNENFWNFSLWTGFWNNFKNFILHKCAKLLTTSLLLKISSPSNRDKLSSLFSFHIFFYKKREFVLLYQNTSKIFIRAFIAKHSCFYIMKNAFVAGKLVKR